MYHRLARVSAPLVLSVQSTPSSEPSVGSLHDPALRIDGKSRVPFIGFDNLKLPTKLPTKLLVELLFEAPVSLIGEDRLHSA